MSSRPSAVKRSSGWGCLALIGLPFIVVGGVMTFLGVKVLYEHRQAQGWQETPARIIAVDLQSHRGSKGGRTYKVTCRYQYQFNDRWYESERVGLVGGSDNIGSWQRDTYHRLHDAYQRGRPITCYVNPENPQQALLDRELRFSLLAFYTGMNGIFGALGLAMLIGAVFSRRTQRREDAYRQQDPDQPWQWKESWHGGTLHPDTGGKAAMFWLMTLLWGLLVSPVTMLIPRELFDRHNYWALLALVFPLIGVALLWQAIRLTVQHRRFGRSHLRLITFPGQVGRRFQAELVLVGDVSDLEAIEARLHCQRAISTGHGKNRRTETNTAWEATSEHRHFDQVFGASELRLPLSFTLPEDCRPTDEADDDDVTKWTLEVRGTRPGVDLNLTFEVPIFRPEDVVPSTAGTRAQVEA